MARFTKYSVANSLLVAMQKPEATRLAGFQSWKSFGRYVKKDEKGIMIIAPMVFRPQDEENAESYDGLHKDRTILRFKAMHVFDVSQTDGKPLPEIGKFCGNSNGYIDLLKTFIVAKGITLEYSREMGAADGISCGGTIKLRPDLSPAEEFSVLAHETAHELLHRGDAKRELSRTVRETEAEAVAFVVCLAIGLETGTASSDYIQLYLGDRKLLMASLDRIRQTAVEILEAIDNPPAQMAQRVGSDSPVDREVAREPLAELIRAA